MSETDGIGFIKLETMIIRNKFSVGFSFAWLCSTFWTRIIVKKL